MKLYKNLSSASQAREDVTALKISVKGEEFPSELLDFPNLEELYLEGNCKKFPDTGITWEKLKILSIKWPGFTGDLSSLFRLPRLENLKIIETPLKTFLLPLGNAPAPIKSLTIKDCGLKSLPEEMGMLQSLSEANFSGNNLSALPHGLLDLKFLKRLNLDHNQFQIFPDLIKKMPNLSHLSIDHNPFPDDEKDRIQRIFHIWIN
ncbi:leucine-rich repeat domain-containing protein [Peredibacter sp. HCB2-198]|uniref:leucine-rich repeat domain-containing protein n=1 Tax=Peredibacter sp. HCB2-198 TaxID=3383025 RepID=UPI0038B4A149